VLTAAAQAEATATTVKVHARSGKASTEVPFELVVTRAHASAGKSRAPKPDRSQAVVRERRPQQEKKPARLTVRAPADAELEMEGARGGRGGETCYFESPPLEVGDTYTCTLKLTWRGWTMTRQVLVRPCQEVTVDLTQELEPPKPEAKAREIH